MRKTLRLRAVVAAVSLVVAVMAVLAWLQARQLGQAYAVLHADQQNALAQEIAKDLDERLDTRLVMLERAALAISPNALTDAAEQRRFFDRLSGARPLFDGMALVGVDGTVLANDPPLNGTVINVRDRDYFIGVISTGEPTVSRPLRSRSTREPAVVMAVPVRDANAHLVGVLAGGLNLSRSNLLGGVNRTRPVAAGHVEVTSGGPNPVYVAHPDPAKLLTPAGEVDGASGDGGTAGGSGFATVRTAGWQLRLVTSDQRLGDAVALVQRRVFAEIGLLACLTAALVWLGVRRGLEPLGRLHRAVLRVSEAEAFELAVQVPAGDEVGDLARDFEGLMHRLRGHHAQLEAVAHASPLGLFRTDVGGRVTYANSSYRAILGLRQSDDGKLNWTDLLPEEQRPRVTEAWDRAARNAASWRIVQELVRPGGTVVLVSIRIAPIVVDQQLAGHAGTLSDITERARGEKAQRTLTAVFDATSDLVFQASPAGNLVYLNPAACHARGWELDAAPQGRTVAEFLPPATVRQFVEQVQPQAVNDGLWVGESVFFDHDLREVPASAMVIAHRDPTGKVEYYSGIFRDISAEKASREALNRSEQTMRDLTDALPVLVAVVDADERYQFANPAYVQAMRSGDGLMVGVTLLDALGPTTYATIKPFVDRALAGERVSYERDRQGGRGHRTQEAIYIPQFDGDGQVRGFIVVVQDVTERKRQETKLRQMAHLDPLTSLLNRAGFDAQLKELAARAALRGTGVGLLYVDLDHFKAVNDTYGHAVGDELLRIFGQRVRNILRPDDVVARLGGDEFVLAIGDTVSLDVAELVASKVVSAAANPFWIEGQSIDVGASVGVSLWLPDEMTVEAALQRADTMLYRAKAAGRGQFQGGHATRH